MDQTVIKEAGILIVDDHPMMRQGLAQLINNEPDLTVAGEAENAKQALSLFRSQPVADPHAVLFHSLHAPDSCRKVGTEQPTIGSLVRKAADSSQAQNVRNFSSLPAATWLRT